MASLTVSRVIDRPPQVVFEFTVINHLRNHPRWDPRMHLEQLTDGAIRLGTRFRRRHTRLDTPIDGEMEVVEFEPPRSVGFVVHDRTAGGDLEVRSRMVLEPEGDQATRLTISLDVPTMHESMDPRMVEASLANMKELIESET